MISNSLNNSEFHPYYKYYIDNASDTDILKGLKANLKTIITFLNTIPEDKQDYAYTEGKWTIKDLLIHIIDTERIFAYRALRISRGDVTPLAGFEQDDYVTNANALNRTYNSIIEEYTAVRKATITLFKSFDSNVLIREGLASDASVSVRALGYMITGHENHHIQIIKERYL